MSDSLKSPPPAKPTFQWALQHVRDYLDGNISVPEFYAPLAKLSGYYKKLYPDPRDGADDTLYDFIGQAWVRSSRVLRKMNDEDELKELLAEWLPDLINGASGTR